MNEKQRRITAIQRVAQGETVTAVCADLGRPRNWYYKWKERYRTDGVAGLEDRRGGVQEGQCTPEWVKKVAVETRDRLVRQAKGGKSFQGIGAREVVREMRKLGITPPHWRTIHSVLLSRSQIPYHSKVEKVRHFQRHIDKVKDCPKLHEGEWRCTLRSILQ